MNDSPRSMLFVSGEKPQRFVKAMAAGADVVCMDLEDAVQAAFKAEARLAVIEFARHHARTRPASGEGPALAARVNAITARRRSPWQHVVECDPGRAAASRCRVRRGPGCGFGIGAIVFVWTRLFPALPKVQTLSGGYRLRPPQRPRSRCSSPQARV